MKINIRALSKELIERFKTDDIAAWAAQLSFYLLLSIFPFAILVMEILDKIDFITIDAIYELARFLPEEVVQIIQLLITDITQSESPSTTILITSFAALFSASRGIQAIIKSLNVAYQVKESRSFFRLKGISLVYTLFLALLLIIVLGLIIFGNKILALLMGFKILSDLPVSLSGFVRYLFAIAATFFFFTMIYNVAPNRKVSFRDELPGALFSTLFFILLSYCFSIYVNNSSNLSYVYGSLTSIVILMLWLFFMSIIIMIGGEINGAIATLKREPLN